MQIFQPIRLAEASPCPYLPQRHYRPEFFFATDLSTADVAALLEAGWRKFGIYFFRPACPACRSCIPLRVDTSAFVPSRSQRRVLKRNADLRVSYGPLQFSERIFAIYREHSLTRFGQEVDQEEFLYNFFMPSCPALQTEIHLGDELIGVGFLDRGDDCLSSVYFCFDPRHDERNLGTFGALQEIACARSLGLPYYYLGYFVPGCPRMTYKDHFRPREYFDWERGTWFPVETSPARCTAPGPAPL